jgi:hypothetical protein
MTRLLLGLVASALFAGTTSAHHSFAAEYFETEMVTMEGELLEFQYKNPHSIIVFLALDESSRPQKYTAEFGGTNRLQRDGISTATFKVGDKLILSGSPGRRVQDRKLHLKGIHRPSDGWKWGRVQ